MNREKPITTFEDNTHIVRCCINCGHDDPQTRFTFTRDFQIDVRKQDPSLLDSMKFNEDTTSTIVECKRCGCIYIRDVFVADEEQHNQPWPEQKIEETLLRYQKEFSRSSATHLQFQIQVINILMRIALRKKASGELSLLDFGASIGMLPLMARMKGFDQVIAYDVKFPPNISDLVSQRHPLNVILVRKKTDLLEYAPFDAIVCQSADEHFLDLKGEFKLMHDLLSDDGILYISHPIMDLNADIDDLKNEHLITDKSRLKALRKTYHIDHLNYVMPKMFSNMLKESGFKEKKIFFLLRFMDVGSLHPRNLMRLCKATIKYLLDVLGMKYRKVVYFVEKTL
ncbi:MAG: methyltransferase domain-containing protein [Acidobacteriota bacterium]|nr:methyltransferase domain-containing protein [Acidobacteriota bacterium]